jgi:hypothetical protein
MLKSYGPGTRGSKRATLFTPWCVIFLFPLSDLSVIAALVLPHYMSLTPIQGKQGLIRIIHHPVALKTITLFDSCSLELLLAFLTSCPSLIGIMSFDTFPEASDAIAMIAEHPDWAPELEELTPWWPRSLPFLKYINQTRSIRNRLDCTCKCKTESQFIYS